jgi:hypothetical protein
MDPIVSSLRILSSLTCGSSRIGYADPTAPYLRTISCLRILSADCPESYLRTLPVVLGPPGTCGPYQVDLRILSGSLPSRTYGSSRVVLTGPLSSRTCGASRVVRYLRTLSSRTCEPSRVVLADPIKSICVSRVLPRTPSPESYLRILPSRALASSLVVPADPPESCPCILSSRTCGSSLVVPLHPL